jgi:hypothetical protein
MAATASATRVFGARLFQRLAQDLGLHGLAAEQALQLAHLGLEFADPAGRDHVLVRPDGLEPAFGHEPPPPEQQAGGNAVQPGDGGNRHAGLRVRSSASHPRPAGRRRQCLRPSAVQRFRRSRPVMIPTRSTGLDMGARLGFHPGPHVAPSVRSKWGALHGLGRDREAPRTIEAHSVDMLRHHVGPRRGISDGGQGRSIPAVSASAGEEHPRLSARLLRRARVGHRCRMRTSPNIVMPRGQEIGDATSRPSSPVARTSTSFQIVPDRFCTATLRRSPRGEPIRVGCQG